MPEPREPLTEAELDGLVEHATKLIRNATPVFMANPATVLRLVEDVRRLRAALAQAGGDEKWTADERLIDDGFGNVWSLCERADCGLHVVRPGKAQCYCDVEAPE